MSLPNFLSQVKTKQKKSQNQEKRLAKEGYVVPGSGSSFAAKGDVNFEDILFECKRTDKKSMSVKGEWLAKIFSEAVDLGKEAGIELEIGDYLIQGIVRRKPNVK